VIQSDLFRSALQKGDWSFGSFQYVKKYFFKGSIVGFGSGFVKRGMFQILLSLHFHMQLIIKARMSLSTGLVVGFHNRNEFVLITIYKTCHSKSMVSSWVSYQDL
jgi:hypothetical protein